MSKNKDLSTKSKHKIEKFLEKNYIKKQGIIHYLRISNQIFRTEFDAPELDGGFEKGCLNFLRLLAVEINDFLTKYNGK